MENTKQRSLGYLLSTAVQDNPLEDISGGTLALPVQHLGQQTLTATGSSAQGPDLTYDHSFDF